LIERFQELMVSVERLKAKIELIEDLLVGRDPQIDEEMVSVCKSALESGIEEIKASSGWLEKELDGVWKVS